MSEDEDDGCVARCRGGRGFIGGMPAYEGPKLSADVVLEQRRSPFVVCALGGEVQWIAVFRIDAVAVRLLLLVVLDTRGPRSALLSSLLVACRQT